MAKKSSMNLFVHWILFLVGLVIFLELQHLAGLCIAAAMVFDMAIVHLRLRIGFCFIYASGSIFHTIEIMQIGQRSLLGFNHHALDHEEVTFSFLYINFTLSISDAKKSTETNTESM